MGWPGPEKITHAVKRGLSGTRALAISQGVQHSVNVLDQACGLEAGGANITMSGHTDDGFDTICVASLSLGQFLWQQQFLHFAVEECSRRQYVARDIHQPGFEHQAERLNAVPDIQNLTLEARLKLGHTVVMYPKTRITHCREASNAATTAITTVFDLSRRTTLDHHRHVQTKRGPSAEAASCVGFLTIDTERKVIKVIYDELTIDKPNALRPHRLC